MALGVVQVQNTVTDVRPAATRQWLVLQNTSDEAIYIKFDSSTTALTSSNGVTLEPLDIAILTVNTAIKAIHAGAGNKELRYQEELE